MDRVFDLMGRTSPFSIARLVLAAGLLTLGVEVPAQAAALGSQCPAPREVRVGTGASKTAVGDFNRDGRLDAAVVNSFGDQDNESASDDTISVLLNDGKGALVARPKVPVGNRTPAGIVSADFDADGKIDLAVANTDSDDISLTILIGDGEGGFTVRTPVPVSPQLQDLTVADMNGDGRPDLIGAAGDQGVSVLLKGTGATFSHAAGSPFSVGPARRVLAADFNGDGNVDVLTGAGGSAAARVLVGAGTGALVASAASLPPAFDQAITDFNNDGKADIAQINGSQVRIHIGNGSAGFSEASGSPLGTAAADGLAAADFDRDGDVDVATAAGQFLLNDGRGTLAAGALCPVGSAGTVAVDYTLPVAGDFDADGAPDLFGLGSRTYARYLLSSDLGSGGSTPPPGSGTTPPPGSGTPPGGSSGIVRAFLQPARFSVASSPNSARRGSTLVLELAARADIDVTVDRRLHGFRGVRNQAPCRLRSERSLRRSLSRRLSSHLRGNARVERLNRSLRKRRCILYRSVGSLALDAVPAGRSEHRFSGWLNGRRLSPGSYRARVQVVGRDGDRSRAMRAAFRIT